MSFLPIQESTLSVDGSTNWASVKGPVWVSLSGTFGGGTAVIQRALAHQARDGLLDVVHLELTARKARTYLRFAQFSTSQHPQTGHVRAGHLSA